MARLSNRLRRTAAELAHMEKQLARMEARTSKKRAEVEGLRTQVAHLEAAIVEEGSVADGSLADGSVEEGRAAMTGPPITLSSTAVGEVPAARRTEAIVAVLRQRAAPMSPKEITDALRAAGRADELRSVTATLTHLRRTAAIERVGRGQYVAT